MYITYFVLRGEVVDSLNPDWALLRYEPEGYPLGTRARDAERVVVIAVADTWLGEPIGYSEVRAFRSFALGTTICLTEPIALYSPVGSYLDSLSGAQRRIVRATLQTRAPQMWERSPAELRAALGE